MIPTSVDVLPPDVIDQLAAAIAQHLPRRIPLTSQYWSVEEIAAAATTSIHQVREVYATDPTFPPAIRLPSRGKGRGHPRYKATEVLAWIESHREGTASRGGRTNRGAS